MRFRLLSIALGPHPQRTATPRFRAARWGYGCQLLVSDASFSTLNQDPRQNETLLSASLCEAFAHAQNQCCAQTSDQMAVWFQFDPPNGRDA
jgi:hypothetical protein